VVITLHAERESCPDIRIPTTFASLEDAAQYVIDLDVNGDPPEGYDIVATDSDGLRWLYTDRWEPLDMTLLPDEGELVVTVLRSCSGGLTPEQLRVSSVLFQRLTSWLDVADVPV
jgi:hypothetical protein